MDDKLIMDTILSNTKGAADLMLHGTIESPTQDVNMAFKTALTDCLNMQHEIYAKMSAKGWYPVCTAEQQQIEQVKQKFAS